VDTGADAFQPIVVDRNAPIDRQLDQIEAIIEQHKTRLDRLEKVVFSQQEFKTELGVESDSSQRDYNNVASAPASAGTAPVQGADIAERLYNYAFARSEARGESPTEPIVTSAGELVVESSPNMDSVYVIDDSYGMKFGATRTDGGEWQVNANDLSQSEINRIVDFPQTSQAFTEQVNAKYLIRHLQDHQPEQFQRDSGGIRWKDEQGRFAYEFEITRETDGQQSIVGKSGTDTVLSARIDPEGSIRVDVSKIPAEQIRELLNQEAPDANRHQSNQLTQ
jgi:hypothetical protein